MPCPCTAKVVRSGVEEEDDPALAFALFALVWCCAGEEALRASPGRHIIEEKTGDNG